VRVGSFEERAGPSHWVGGREDEHRLLRQKRLGRQDIYLYPWVLHLLEKRGQRKILLPKKRFPLGSEHRPGIIGTCTPPITVKRERGMKGFSAYVPAKKDELRTGYRRGEVEGGEG